MEIQWSLVFFTVVSGAGAWLFFASMVGALAKKGELPTKAESIVSFILLAVGGCLSVTHLKHVDRIFEALNHPTSGIFTEAAMIGVSCALIAIYFILLVRGSSKGALTGVGIAAAVVGAIFTFACGSSYMMAAREVWCTPMLPAAYGFTAAALGFALNLLMKGIAKEEAPVCTFAGLMALIAGIVGGFVALIFVAGTGEAFAEAQLPWTILLIVGAIASIVCGGVAWNLPKSVIASGVVGTVGAFAAAMAVRVIMWMVGTPLLDFFLMPLE